MTAKIIPFTGITKLDLDPDVVLERLHGVLEGFVITGFDKEGNLYYASTYGDGGTALWLLAKCQKALLEVT
jgi:hypothetical protein